MRQNKLHTTIAIFMATMGAAFAQTAPEMVTDRPDQTESASIVPTGWIQIEAGAVFERDEVANITTNTISVPSMLFRFGLFETVEVRVLTEFANRSLESDQPGFTNQSEFGLQAAAIGAKVKLTEEEGIRPEISLLAHLTLPVGTEGLSPSKPMPDARFAFDHGLTESIGLAYNLGAEWDVDNEVITGIYTVALGVDLLENLGAYGELFGELPNGEQGAHWVDGGITLNLATNIQLDASIGTGVNDTASDYFVGAGISVRVPR